MCKEIDTPIYDLIEKILKYFLIGWGTLDSAISIILFFRQEQILNIDLEKTPFYIEYYWIIIFGFLGLSTYFQKNFMMRMRCERNTDMTEFCIFKI